MRARVRGNFVVMLPRFLPSQVPKLKGLNSIRYLVLWQITFTLLWTSILQCVNCINVVAQRKKCSFHRIFHSLPLYLPLYKWGHKKAAKPIRTAQLNWDCWKCDFNQNPCLENFDIGQMFGKDALSILLALLGEWVYTFEWIFQTHLLILVRPHDVIGQHFHTLNHGVGL